MFHIALFQPEIPPNTGNIIRLCANTGCQLHLIHPLAFQLNDKNLKRAGLDYSEWVNIKEHEDFNAFLKHMDHNRIFAFSTKGSNFYFQEALKKEDCFLFGPETRGLPLSILKDSRITNVLKIPMKPKSRSLNLSNSVAIALYEGLRQLNFQDLI